MSDDHRPDAPSGGEAGNPPAGASSPAPAPVVRDVVDADLLALIDRLTGLLERSDLAELEVQVGETGLVLRKPSAIAAPTPTAAPAGASAGSTASGPPDAVPSASGAAGAPAARPSVKAPLTGIWYGSPSPGSAPYVSVGGEVAAGQVIGLIEAMKLFNEIKSDLSGRVVRVHAENGKLVKAKQPLIEVEPL